MMPAVHDTGGAVAHRLRFDCIRPETDAVAGAVTSFKASLETVRGLDEPVAELAGILIDMDGVRTEATCITIHDALRRHTPPKSLSVVSGSAASDDMAGGTDARMSVGDGVELALYMWLPEVEAGTRGGGSRLVDAIRVFLGACRSVQVFLDFGVEDEQDGFVKIFWPKLGRRGLRLSENGRYATGLWGASEPAAPSREIGFVHL